MLHCLLPKNDHPSVSLSVCLFLCSFIHSFVPSFLYFSVRVVTINEADQPICFIGEITNLDTGDSVGGNTNCT